MDGSPGIDSRPLHEVSLERPHSMNKFLWGQLQMQWKASEKWKETWPHLSAFCTMKAAKGQELSWLEMREPGERTLTLWRLHTRHLPQWRHSSSVAILYKRLAMWRAILYKLPGVWKVSLRPRHSTISRYRCRILVDKLPKFLVEGNRWNKQGQRNLWTNQNCKWLCRNELETMFHYFLKYLILWMLHANEMLIKFL